MKKRWGHTHTDTNDTHPGRIIVPDGIYSVGDKKSESVYRHHKVSGSLSMLQFSNEFLFSRRGSRAYYISHQEIMTEDLVLFL